MTMFKPTITGLILQIDETPGTWTARDTGREVKYWKRTAIIKTPTGLVALRIFEPYGSAIDAPILPKNGIVEGDTITAQLQTFNGKTTNIPDAGASLLDCKATQTKK